MSFTKNQEQKLAALADAIDKDSFVGVKDLPEADLNESDKLIEVYSPTKQRSKKISLRNAVNVVGGGGGLTAEERQKLDQLTQGAVTYVPMTEGELNFYIIISLFTNN